MTEERILEEQLERDNKLDIIRLFINHKDPDMKLLERSLRYYGPKIAKKFFATSAYTGPTEAEFNSTRVMGINRIVSEFERY